MFIVYFKGWFRLFVIIEHMVLFGRFALNLFVVAKARTVLKMFLVWAKSRGSLLL